MSAEIVSLAKRRFEKRTSGNPSFYTVRKSGKEWRVMLVTPVTGARDIKTTLVSCSHRDVAVAYAIETSGRTGVPVKIGKAKP